MYYFLEKYRLIISLTIVILSACWIFLSPYSSKSTSFAEGLMGGSFLVLIWECAKKISNNKGKESA